jgi:hypothetical protein
LLLLMVKYFSHGIPISKKYFRDMLMEIDTRNSVRVKKEKWKKIFEDLYKTLNLLLFRRISGGSGVTIAPKWNIESRERKIELLPMKVSILFHHEKYLQSTSYALSITPLWTSHRS